MDTMNIYYRICHMEVFA